MKEIWEEKMKLQCMLEVEIAVCEQLTTEGSIPKEAMETIKEKANFDAERIREIRLVVISGLTLILLPL